MTDAVLQKCLEIAEDAKLPEGDYLQVCEALKKSFSECKRPKPKSKSQSVDISLSNKEEEKCLGRFTFHISEITVVSGVAPNLARWSLTIDQEGHTHETISRQTPLEQCYKACMRAMRVCRPSTVWLKTGDLEVWYERDAVCKIVREEELLELSLMNPDDPPDDEITFNKKDFWRFLQSHIEDEIETEMRTLWGALHSS
jgi:hypothetical protein